MTFCAAADVQLPMPCSAVSVAVPADGDADDEENGDAAGEIVDAAAPGGDGLKMTNFY